MSADVRSIQTDIIDDGIGIKHKDLAKAGSLGLLGIRERLDTCGGMVAVQENGRGGSTAVQIPCNSRGGWKR